MKSVFYNVLSIIISFIILLMIVSYTINNYIKDNKLYDYIGKEIVINGEKRIITYFEVDMLDVSFCLDNGAKVYYKYVKEVLDLDDKKEEKKFEYYKY